MSVNTIKDNERWKWWTDTLEYVRVISGKVYKEQLEKIASENYKKYTRLVLKDAPGYTDIVNYLNSKTPQGNNKKYLKCDELTGGVFTVASQRAELDPILKYYNNEYTFNEYLYKDSYIGNDRRSSIAFSELQGHTKLFNQIFILDADSGELEIDFTQLLRNGFNCFENFNIKEIADYFNKLLSAKPLCFGVLNLSHTLFIGETIIAFDCDKSQAPLFSKGISFNGSTFADDFYAENICFDLSVPADASDHEYNTNKVDFRNARFFGKAIFRDVEFMGSDKDAEVSFEDARIKDSIEIINTAFGNTKVNFFQTVIGDYINLVNSDSKGDKDRHKVRFVNVEISDLSWIDFSDAEIDHTDISFINISYLPMTKLTFAPKQKFEDNDVISCPDNTLLIRNCEIQATIYIGNVSQLSFADTQNYGQIVEADNWGNFKDSSNNKKSDKISNKLLFAVNEYGQDCEGNVNRNNNKDDGDISCNKAKDFVMLKENFASRGKYDDEDEAFILYMKYKPYLDAKRRQHRSGSNINKKDTMTDTLYKILYLTGKYGISPFRVVLSLIVLVFSFHILYLILLSLLGNDCLKLGQTLSSAISNGVFYRIEAAFLYSVANVTPFTSQFEPVNFWVAVLTAIENAMGSFLVGYFSVAVVRKTLR